MSFQPWTNGKHLISSIDWEGDTYNFVAQADIGSGGGDVIWLLLIKGDYSVASPATVCQNKISAWLNNDPYEEVARIIAVLNNDMIAYFGGTMPETWWEKVMDALQKLVLYLKTDGTPALK